MIHAGANRGLASLADRRWARFSCCADNEIPADGPGGRGFHRPRYSFLDRTGGFRAAQGACGRALIQSSPRRLRCQPPRQPSRASSLSQASRVAAVRAAACHALFIASEADGNLPMPQSFPVRMASSTRA